MIRPQLHVIKDLADKRVFRLFAHSNDLVYFGHVDPRDDDYELVRGVTVSTTHVDAHYTVGTIHGRDVLFVQRSNNIVYPGKKPSHHSWLIAQIDMQRTDLPHVFIDVHQHDEVFYASLFARLPQFQDITQIFGGRDANLSKHAKVFGLPQHYAEIGDALAPEVTGPLTKDFKQFDYELHGDKVYVYASKTRASLAVLQDMVRVGLWLADELDAETLTS